MSSLLAGEGSASHQISQWEMLAGMLLIILSQVGSCSGHRSTSSAGIANRNTAATPAKGQ